VVNRLIVANLQKKDEMSKQLPLKAPIVSKNAKNLSKYLRIMKKYYTFASVKPKRDNSNDEAQRILLLLFLLYKQL